MLHCFSPSIVSLNALLPNIFVIPTNPVIKFSGLLSQGNDDGDDAAIFKGQATPPSCLLVPLNSVSKGTLCSSVIPHPNCIISTKATTLTSAIRERLS